VNTIILTTMGRSCFIGHPPGNLVSARIHWFHITQLSSSIAKELYSRIKLLVKIKNVYGHAVLEAAGELGISYLTVSLDAHIFLTGARSIISKLKA
jgi:hypothetical protein